jgi:hypothetical protein
MQFSQKLIALAVLALVSAAMFATSAAGDPGNGSGAMITSMPTTCETFFGVTQCVTIKGEYHFFTDAAGKTHFNYNEWRYSTFEGPGIPLQTGETRSHSEGVSTDDGTGTTEFRLGGTGSQSFTDANGVFHTCSSTSAFHIAHGEVQYDRLTFTCT